MANDLEIDAFSVYHVLCSTSMSSCKRHGASGITCPGRMPIDILHRHTTPLHIRTKAMISVHGRACHESAAVNGVMAFHPVCEHLAILPSDIGIAPQAPNRRFW